MRILSVLLVAVVFVCAGCGEKSGEEGAAAADTELESRIGALESQNRALQKELDRFQQGYEALQLQVASLANSAGDAGDIEELVAEALQKQRAAREERERTERAERHKEWEKRRKQAEKQRVDEFAEKLDLNDEQKEEVKEAWAQMAKSARESWGQMRNEGDWDREKMTKAFEKLATDHSDAMKKILNEEQFAKYGEMEDSIMRRFEWLRGRGGDRGGRGHRGGNGRDGGDRREEKKED